MLQVEGHLLFCLEEVCQRGERLSSPSASNDDGEKILSVVFNLRSQEDRQRPPRRRCRMSVPTGGCYSPRRGCCRYRRLYMQLAKVMERLHIRLLLLMHFTWELHIYLRKWRNTQSCDKSKIHSTYGHMVSNRELHFKVEVLFTNRNKEVVSHSGIKVVSLAPIQRETRNFTDW